MSEAGEAAVPGDVLAAVGDKFARYLGEKIHDAEEVAIRDMKRIHGGASRETFRLTATYIQGGKTVERGLILRRDPVGSLIDTERELEFNAYRAFHGTKVPVPEPLYLETDESWLERPFFVMEEVAGCQAASPFAADPYGPLAEKIGDQFWSTLAEIAKADPDANGLSETMEKPAPDRCWKRELDYWEGVINEDELEPQPIVRAAIRYLRRNPPPPAQKVGVVHGDYRTGNFLFDDSGEIRAILDWEMSHLGDPLEDLAWSIDPLWSYQDRAKAGLLLPRAEAVRLWEEKSGLKADPEALAWWETFSAVKGLAIWISSGHEYVSGQNQDPVLAFSSLICTDAHNRVLIDRLMPAGV